MNHPYPDYNQPKPSAATLAKHAAKYDNPWDDSISPRISLELHSIRHTNKRLSNLHFHLHKLTETSEMKATIYRSRQLAYLQPYFQALLDPCMQGFVYITTIGQKYWVIGAQNSALATRFKFQSQMIHTALSQYVKRNIPPFKIKVYPNSSLPKAPVVEKRSKSPQAEQGMQDIFNILKSCAIHKASVLSHNFKLANRSKIFTKRLRPTSSSGLNINSLPEGATSPINNENMASNLPQHAYAKSQISEILNYLKSQKLS